MFKQIFSYLLARTTLKKLASKERELTGNAYYSASFINSNKYEGHLLEIEALYHKLPLLFKIEKISQVVFYNDGCSTWEEFMDKPWAHSAAAYNTILKVYAMNLIEKESLSKSQKEDIAARLQKATLSTGLEELNIIQRRLRLEASMDSAITSNSTLYHKPVSVKIRKI